MVVPVSSIAAMSFCAAVSVLLPLILLISARLHWRVPVLPALAGAAVFPLFVFVFEALASRMLLSSEAVVAFIHSNGFIYALYGGLMASLFEETGRMIAFIFLGRWYGESGCAFSYGIGHGGIEAILLIGIPMVGNILLAVQLNGLGGMESLLQQVPELAGMADRLSTLYAGEPYLFIVSGIERIAAIVFHIAASVLVWMAVSRRGPFWLFFLAMLCHMLLNIPAGLYQFGMLENIWLLEGVTVLISAVVCGYTAYIYRYYGERTRGLMRYVPFQL